MSESGSVGNRRSHDWASDPGWLAHHFVGGRRGALGGVLGRLSSSREPTKAGAVSHDVCDVFRVESRLSEHEEMLLGSAARGGRRRRLVEPPQHQRGAPPRHSTAPRASVSRVPVDLELADALDDEEQPRHPAIAAGDGLTLPVPMARITQCGGSDG
jgi:hypothetical protein